MFRPIWLSSSVWNCSWWRKFSSVTDNEFRCWWHLRKHFKSSQAVCLEEPSLCSECEVTRIKLWPESSTFQAHISISSLKNPWRKAQCMRTRCNGARFTCRGHNSDLGRRVRCLTHSKELEGQNSAHSQTNLHCTVPLYHHYCQNKPSSATAFIRRFGQTCPFLGIRPSGFRSFRFLNNIFFWQSKAVSLRSNLQPGLTGWRSLSYGRRSVDQFILVFGPKATSSSWYRAPHWGPWLDFIFILS
jgi:hypothetical protein